MGEEFLSLKWNNHKAAYTHVLQTLREKAAYTDLSLVCGTQVFHIHKLVLIACSRYFSELLLDSSEIFDNDCSGRMVVVLNDVSPQDMDALLDYMYLGEVSVPKTSLSELIRVAETLKIRGLTVPNTDPDTATITLTTTTTTTQKDDNKRKTRKTKKDQSNRIALNPTSDAGSDATADLPVLEVTEVKTEADDLSVTYDPRQLEFHEHFILNEEGQVVVKKEQEEEGLSKLPPPLPPPPPPPQPQQLTMPLSPTTRRRDGKLQYLCPFCGKVESDRYKWRRHVRKHTGEKPYTCHHCSYSCANRHSLLRHERHKHQA